jgi:hypothetical protein
MGRYTGDNMRDKAVKGRTGRAKLTNVEIAKIKLFLEAGEPNQRQIAAWYGISASMSAILIQEGSMPMCHHLPRDGKKMADADRRSGYVL